MPTVLSWTWNRVQTWTNSMAISVVSGSGRLGRVACAKNSDRTWTDRQQSALRNISSARVLLSSSPGRFETEYRRTLVSMKGPFIQRPACGVHRGFSRSAPLKGGSLCRSSASSRASRSNSLSPTQICFRNPAHERGNGGIHLGSPNARASVGLIVYRNCDIFHRYTVSQPLNMSTSHTSFAFCSVL